MTNSLKDIVTKLVDSFDTMCNDYFMNGEFFEQFINIYDSPELSRVKREIKHFNLYVTCTSGYGGEDMGSAYWSVYKFTQNDESVYVKFNGFYQSYNGAEFTEWFFVEPKEKVVIEYDRVKNEKI